MAGKVEMRPAWAWDCPECGVELFARAIVPEFSEDELAQLKADAGDDWNDADFCVMSPLRVECTECGREFETIDYNSETPD